ncbi:MAG TPA: 30S ribosomal protein S17 [Thermoanaerobaculia bacterium]
MADQTDKTPAAAQERGRRQVLTGTVVSDKMDKTVVVKVERTVVHRLYQRYMKRTSKFTAHDEKNECRLGDRVTIVQSRPLSKRKRWRVGEIVERAK